MPKTIELERLPQAARQELFDFYDFLMQKYAAAPKRIPQAAKETRSARSLRLNKLFDESMGKLPQDYRFNRDDAHERQSLS
jgi:hypothetical protein